MRGRPAVQTEASAAGEAETGRAVGLAGTAAVLHGAGRGRWWCGVWLSARAGGVAGGGCGSMGRAELQGGREGGGEGGFKGRKEEAAGGGAAEGGVEGGLRSTGGAHGATAANGTRGAAGSGRRLGGLREGGGVYMAIAGGGSRGGGRGRRGGGGALGGGARRRACGGGPVGVLGAESHDVVVLPLDGYGERAHVPRARGGGRGEAGSSDGGVGNGGHARRLGGRSAAETYCLGCCCAMPSEASAQA